jgi:hypothetical protein
VTLPVIDVARATREDVKASTARRMARRWREGAKNFMIFLEL